MGRKMEGGEIGEMVGGRTRDGTERRALGN